jgi:hypothetical protein
MEAGAMTQATTNPPRLQLEKIGRRCHQHRLNSGVRVMGRIITTVALIGWAIIIWIAWHLANARIALCGPVLPDESCLIRTTAARDFTLTVGLTGGLLIILAALALYGAPAARLKRGGAATGWKPTSQGQRALPR